MALVGFPARIAETCEDRYRIDRRKIAENREGRYLVRSMATLVLLVALAFVVGACGVRNVTIGEIETGPAVTEEIDVPGPAGGGTARVEIGMGGGDLSITTGSVDGMIKGTVAYNMQDLKPSVQIQGNQVRIEQGDIEGRRIPIGNWKDVENHWDLTLGTAPLTLSVNAGAARAELTGLADLNAAEIHFAGGAGDLTLEFSGSLRQDMRVSVDAGAAQVTLIVPRGTAAEATFKSALTDIDTQGDWEKSGNQYVLAGEGPKITFVIQMGVGRLEMRKR